MKILLYFTAMGSFGAALYYYGISWWMFPLFVLCMVLIKIKFDKKCGQVSEYKIFLRFLSKVAIAVLFGFFLYTVIGEGDYQARAIGYIETTANLFVYVSNVWGVLTLILLFGGEPHGYAERVLRNPTKNNNNADDVYQSDDFHTPPNQFIDTYRQEVETNNRIMDRENKW